MVSGPALLRRPQIFILPWTTAHDTKSPIWRTNMQLSHSLDIYTKRKKYEEKWDQGKEIIYYIYSPVKLHCVEPERRYLPVPPSNSRTHGRHPRYKPRGRAVGSVAKGNLALVKDQKKSRIRVLNGSWQHSPHEEISVKYGIYYQTWAGKQSIFR